MKGELLIEALKRCKYDPDKLLTADGNEGFYAKKFRDALVTYDPSSITLNKLYGRLYDRRYEIGELDIAARYDDLPVSFAEAIQKTLAGRVRYDAVYEESTTSATSMAAFYGFDEKEGVYSPYMQTNQRNLRVLDPSMDGIFDPQATGGEAYNQGLVRYLTEDATVGEGGALVPGSQVYCALLNEPEFANCIRYNDWVRVPITG